MDFYSSEALTRQWTTPEIQDAVRRHTAQNIAHGLFGSYKVASQIYGNPNSPQFQKRQVIALAELPLVAKVDPFFNEHEASVRDYYLEKVSSHNGETLVIEADGCLDKEDSRVFVASAYKDGTIVERYEFFTELQAQLVVRQAEELRGLGIDY